MAIEALTGNNAALWVQTGGTVEAPTFEMVGLQRGLTHEQARELIDASHKGSDFMQSVYGRQSSTMTMEALEPDPDFGGAAATHDALYDAQNNKTTILVELRKVGTEGTIVRRAAEALVGTISSEYPDNDVSVISLELNLQGPLEEVVAGP